MVKRRKRKDVKYCAVYDCLNTSRDPSLKFFVLPQDAERRRMWLTAIDREDLLTKEDLKPASYTVCSSHFERSAMKIVPKLHNDAVPTIFSLNQSQEGISNSELQKSVNVSTQTEPQIKMSEKKIINKATSTEMPGPSAGQLPDEPDTEVMQTVVKDETEEAPAALHDDMQVKSPGSEIGGEQNELYAEHEIKEELTIGPVVLQKPGPSTEQSLGGATLSKRPRLEINYEEQEQEKSSARKSDDTVAGENASETVILQANIIFHSNEPDDDDDQTAKKNRKLYFKCTECEYTAVTRDTLDKHLRLHDRERQHVCAICSFRFKAKGTLRRHMNDLHSVNKKNICEINDKIQNNILQRCELVHRGAKTFSCPQCEFKSARKSNLKKHLLIHTGEKTLSCPQCHHKCITRYELKVHLRTHTGEKPFSCPLCQYRFASQFSLKKHLSARTCKKNFSCPQCQYKSNFLRTMKFHIRTHTGEKPITCP